MSHRKSYDTLLDESEVPKDRNSIFLDENDSADHKSSEQKKDSGWSVLHDCAAQGRTEDISIILEQDDEDINCLSKEKETPLFVAAKANKEECVKQLLKFGASPQIANIKGLTPLHVASYYGHVKIVAFLTHNTKVDVNGKDDKGRTPLHLAAFGGHDEVITELISNENIDLSAKNNIGETPLHVACKKNFAKIVEIFMEAKAPLEVTTIKNESTPLHYAASNGHAKIVKILLKNGAKVEAVTKNGKTPLHFAALKNFEEVVELLINAGSNIDFKSEKDLVTALHLAAYFGQKVMVSLLISKGADLNSKDMGGMTPLHNACERGHLEIVQLLIQAKADINATDSQNCKPIDLARNNNHADIVNFLENKKDVRLLEQFPSAMNLPKRAKPREDNEDLDRANPVQVTTNELPKSEEKPSPCSYFFKCICCCFSHD